MTTVRTIKYGDHDLPIVERHSWAIAESQPYRKTYSLKPGQCWFDADVTSAQRENYVLLANGKAMPVGAVIAQELLDEGATSAVFTELWGGLVLVGADLVCVNEEGPIHEVLEAMRTETQGRLVGLPDVVAVFPNGRIIMREAKVALKDRLSPKQHEFARIAQMLFGDRLDLAVVEWGVRAKAS